MLSGKPPNKNNKVTTHGFQKKSHPQKRQLHETQRKLTFAHLAAAYKAYFPEKKPHNEVAIKVLPNNCDLPNSDKYTKHWQQLWREGRTHTI